jgi:hypothetical protein
MLLVSAPETHQVLAFDAATGKPQWSYTSGGRIDSPPTIHQGAVLFGSADGWIYCLNLKTGDLVWRFLAAKQPQQMVAYDQVESVWPVSGSVLVKDNAVYTVSGRTPYLDDGMILYKLNPATGALITKTEIKNKDCLPDVLSWQNGFLYLRNLCFDDQLNDQPPETHLYPSKGFLDDSWWHRLYWVLGTQIGSGYGKWTSASRQAPSGRIMVIDNDMVYGYGRIQLSSRGSHPGFDNTTYSLYALDLNEQGKASPEPAAPARKGKKKRSRLKPSPLVFTWKQSVPLFTRAMVLAENTLCISGPQNVLQNITGHTLFSDLSAQADILRNQKPSMLHILSAADGRKLSDISLDSSPVFDGLIAANRKLFLSTENGKVLCLGQQD